jgi:capsular polysaccharide biosynthesis protein
LQSLILNTLFYFWISEITATLFYFVSEVFFCEPNYGTKTTVLVISANDSGASISFTP